MCASNTNEEHIYIYKNMENKDIINKYTSVCNVYEDTA